MPDVVVELNITQIVQDVTITVDQTIQDVALAVDDTIQSLNLTVIDGKQGPPTSVITFNVSVDTVAEFTPGAIYVYFLSNGAKLTLPTALLNTSLYSVKNADGSAVSVDTTDSQPADGSLLINLPIQYQALNFISNGTNWGIF